MQADELGGAPEQALALPRGFRDILPSEARELYAIRRTLMAAFESYGYVPLEPPTVELADGAATSVDEHRLLRFLDRDGSLLALRPDLTTAVARVVAQRYRDARGALRLAYIATVFRQEHSMRGSEREYDQAGVELIGPGGALADVEVVALLADALCACGLADAEIDVSHAGLIGGFLEGLPPDDRDRALERARAGDLVGFVGSARAAGLAPSWLEQLRDALRYRGPIEPLLARRDALPPRSGSALDEMREFAALLDPAGVRLPVRYDLGLVARLPYYTGIVFRATAPGLGSAVASGGRYDGLLSRFGADRPATGFAIAVPHLHQAIVAAGWSVDDGTPLVSLDGAAPADILRVAKALRREGLAVAIGETADSAGRAVVRLRVLDGGRIEHEGRVATIAEAAAAITSVSNAAGSPPVPASTRATT